MKHLTLFLSFFLLLNIASFSQDIILKVNDELIHCKIREIGLDEIKYNLPDFAADVLFVVDKDDISKIIFENGKEMMFQQAMNNPDNYINNRKNALKVEFLSPLFGNTTLAWERSLKPGRSYEITLGLVGLGLDTYYEDPGGVFTKFGYKFIKSPDFYLRGMKYAHLLKGSYFKPELSLGWVKMNVFRYNDAYDPISGYYFMQQEETREPVFAAAIQAVIGKQWVFDNAFLADIHFGLGYGFNTASDNWSNTYHSGFISPSEGFPISVSGGFKIGFLLK